MAFAWAAALPIYFLGVNARSSCFTRLGELESVDKGAECGGVDTLAAGQCFELFIGLGNAVSPHNGLDGFREHLPAMVEIIIRAWRH